MLNKRGPRIDPWGTPDFIDDQVLKDVFTLVLCFLSKIAKNIS